MMLCKLCPVWFKNSTTAASAACRIGFLLSDQLTLQWSTNWHSLSADDKPLLHCNGKTKPRTHFQGCSRWEISFAFCKNFTLGQRNVRVTLSVEFWWLLLDWLSRGCSVGGWVINQNAWRQHLWWNNYKVLRIPITININSKWYLKYLKE